MCTVHITKLYITQLVTILWFDEKKLDNPLITFRKIQWVSNTFLILQTNIRWNKGFPKLHPYNLQTVTTPVKMVSSPINLIFSNYLPTFFSYPVYSFPTRHYYDLYFPFSLRLCQWSHCVFSDLLFPLELYVSFF